MTDYATEWRAAGACVSADPDLFFPVATGTVAAVQVQKAQRICAGCQVRQECFDFAVRSGETHGVWGGTTPEERVRVRRQRGRLARRAWLGGQGPDSQRSMQPRSSSVSTGLVT